jgi:membrane glycosyltransferase
VMTEERLRRAACRRRTAYFGLTLGTSTIAATLMWEVLSANGVDATKLVGLVLFFLGFAWTAGVFWSALAGFVICLRGRDDAVPCAAALAGRRLNGRTAIIMPIYNEDTKRVAAGLESLWTELRALPEQDGFDLFILSDTSDPQLATSEELAWRCLVERHDASGRIFYRRRKANVGRKAGNIADFVRCWGGAYDYAVVLDADSIMSGAAIVALSRLMDANPRAGIIQSLSLPVGRQTLFARLIQFAARLSSPMLARGLAYWQLSESNYWGHNAILRLRPFAQHCGLPRLPGEAPLGGEILSHDFVEAALMRRAGWQVWFVAQMGGSWEEMPSNVLDYAARDRRWAQGNLQHLRLLTLRGLHWVSRLHLLTGAMSYAASPLWLAALVLSSVRVCQNAINGHRHLMPGTDTLFPRWPEYPGPQIAALLAMTALVLFGPKLLGALLALADSSLRRSFGGARRLLVSLLIEQSFSILLAPAMMMFHTEFVVGTLAGSSVRWQAQERGDRSIRLPEAMARHGWHMLLGLGWAAAILAIAPRYIWWILPVVGGLILCVPLTLLTSRTSLGRWALARGILLTPEETHPPRELTNLARALASDCLLATQPPPAILPSHALRVPTRAPLPMEATPLAELQLHARI